MNGRLRVGFVVNFEPSDPPGEWLGAYLPAAQFRSSVVRALPRTQSRSDRSRLLPPYARELFDLAMQRPRLDEYDVLFTWELRTTLATLLLQHAPGAWRARVVSLNPTLKGWPLRLLPVVRSLLRRTDCIVAFSTAEAAALRRLLRLDDDRVVHLPRFADATAMPPSQAASRPFVMALGHTNRDFPTLWDAIRGSDMRVLMYRNAWMSGRELPNVTAMPTLLDAAAEARLVASAQFHVIPLCDTPFSSGLTVLLRAMACGKAVIVSDTTGIRDYVDDGCTGVLVPPHDPVALRAAMDRLWADADERKRIGDNAARSVRERFDTPHFVRRIGELACAVTAPASYVKEAVCDFS